MTEVSTKHSENKARTKTVSSKKKAYVSFATNKEGVHAPDFQGGPKIGILSSSRKFNR